MLAQTHPYRSTHGHRYGSTEMSLLARLPTALKHHDPKPLGEEGVCFMDYSLLAGELKLGSKGGNRCRRHERGLLVDFFFMTSPTCLLRHPGMSSCLEVAQPTVAWAYLYQLLIMETPQLVPRPICGGHLSGGFSSYMSRLLTKFNQHTV